MERDQADRLCHQNDFLTTVVRQEKSISEVKAFSHLNLPLFSFRFPAFSSLLKKIGTLSDERVSAIFIRVYVNVESACKGFKLVREQ